MDGYKPFGSADSGVDGESGNTDSLSQPAEFLTLRAGSASGDGSGSDSGDSSGDSGEFDPAIHVSPDKRNRDGSFTRKRGRKAGASASGDRYSGRSNKGYKANIDSLTSVLAIVHAGLASATKTPELALDTDEATSLAQATANVLIEFDVQPNPKVQAVVGLVMVAGSLYGPRVYLIKERRKEEKEKRAERSN